MPEPWKCDFCSDANVAYLYECEEAQFICTEEVDGKFFDHMSTEGWAACYVCHGLMQRHQKNRLVDRAYAAFGERMRIELNLDEQKGRAALAMVHKKFFKAWRGKYSALQNAGN